MVIEIMVTRVTKTNTHRIIIAHLTLIEDRLRYDKLVNNSDNPEQRFLTKRTRLRKWGYCVTTENITKKQWEVQCILKFVMTWNCYQIDIIGGLGVNTSKPKLHFWIQPTRYPCIKKLSGIRSLSCFFTSDVSFDLSFPTSVYCFLLFLSPSW